MVESGTPALRVIEGTTLREAGIKSPATERELSLDPATDRFGRLKRAGDLLAVPFLYLLIYLVTLAAYVRWAPSMTIDLLRTVAAKLKRIQPS
jgi:hypothetical protein